MECTKTVSKQHIWEPFEIHAEFSGTVGYYRTYVLKCITCDRVNDRFRETSSPPTHNMNNVLNRLLERIK